jgi:hypothetical protein
VKLILELDAMETRTVDLRAATVEKETHLMDEALRAVTVVHDDGRIETYETEPLHASALVPEWLQHELDAHEELIYG